MQTQEKAELIADEIRKVSKAICRFRDGPLTERCVVVLLQDATKLPKTTIEKVLNGIDALEDLYLKPE